MRIFLSHSSTDKNIVRKMNKALESQGYKTWLDENDILIGDSITNEIGKGLKEADVVLVFLSKHSVASRWVSTEWQTKFFNQVNKGEVYILPLLIENCDIPNLLEDKKYADFTDLDSYETNLSNLLRTLRIIELKNNEKKRHLITKAISVFKHTKELLNELEDEKIVLPNLSEIHIVDRLKFIKRSGKFVRLDSFNKPKIKIRSIYDHTLSVAYLADCLLPLVKSGISAVTQTELSRIIAFHEFNETILGDIPAYTNLKEKYRISSANPAEQTLRSVTPERREHIANEFIWLFLSEKQRLSLESVLDNLSHTQSNLTVFFKLLDKIDPIISIWRYLNYYRGKIEDIEEFLTRLNDFFENPGVTKYLSTIQYGEQLYDFITILQNKQMAKEYYDDQDFIEKHSDLFSFPHSKIKEIIEGCPLFLDEHE